MKRLMTMVCVMLLVSSIQAQNMRILSTEIQGLKGDFSKLEIASTVKVQMPQAKKEQYLCAVVMNIGEKWNSPKTTGEFSALIRKYCYGGFWLPAVASGIQTIEVPVDIDLDLNRLNMDAKSGDVYIQTFVLEPETKKLVTMSQITKVDPACLQKNAVSNEQREAARQEMMEGIQDEMMGGLLEGLITGGGGSQIGEDGKVECPVCKGTGRCTHNVTDYGDSCPDCKERKCLRCDGTGRSDPDLMQGTIGPAMKEKLKEQGIDKGTFSRAWREMRRNSAKKRR